MYFLKYKHIFAYGSHDYEYRFLGYDYDNEWAKEISENIEEEYSWSEHYRGLDYKIVKEPPIEWVVDRIKSLNSEIEGCKSRLIEYNNLLEKIKSKK